MGATAQELARYIVNGIAATAVHYGVLTFNLEIAEMPSASLANGIAAVFGITASFLGSRYFVFRGKSEPLPAQLIKFGALYGAIGVLHALFLAIWTDWMKFDYRIGFILATGLQFLLSYSGNKYLVFIR